MTDPATNPPETADDAKPDAAAPTSAETITMPVAEFERLKHEVLEWKERCMRQQAEFENARRRLRKEADEAGTRATARSVKPVLNEMDNLSRAIGAATSESFSDFAQGVAMIHENLKAALGGMGLEPVSSEGIFDPAVHEVLAEQECADLPRGTIVQVHRSGWKLKDQLVRAAQVVVARPVTTSPAAAGPEVTAPVPQADGEPTPQAR